MKKFIIRLAVYVVLVALFIIATAGLYYFDSMFYIYTDDAWDDVVPYSLEEKAGDNNIVLSQHSHTLYSDGHMTVKQAALWHKAMGYNTVFITDHNTMEHMDDVIAVNNELDDMLVLMGMEWTTKRIHMNFLGLTEWDFENFPINRQPTDTEIEEAIAEAHRLGAVVVVNHYLWQRAKNKPTREQLIDWGIDYFEIVNDECNELYHYDEEAIDYCQQYELGMITGTDVHIPHNLKYDGRVRGWTFLKTDEFSEQAVMDELQNRNTTIYYSEKGAEPLGDFERVDYYEWIKPLLEIGRYFRTFYMGGTTLNWKNIGLVYMYAIGLFAISEILVFSFNKIRRKAKRQRR